MQSTIIVSLSSSQRRTMGSPMQPYCWRYYQLHRRRCTTSTTGFFSLNNKLFWTETFVSQRGVKDTSHQIYSNIKRNKGTTTTTTLARNKNERLADMYHLNLVQNNYMGRSLIRTKLNLTVATRAVGANSTSLKSTRREQQYRHQHANTNNSHHTNVVDWKIAVFFGTIGATVLGSCCYQFNVYGNDIFNDDTSNDEKIQFNIHSSTHHLRKQHYLDDLLSQLQPQIINSNATCEAFRTPVGAAEATVHSDYSTKSRFTERVGESTNATQSSTKPRNVMIHRFRSIRGRNLTDKYNVDWDTVLGEGAYGSVHPARLKATHGKVALKKISRHYTNVSTFKGETDALLRLYDNGGHPNISGLRDMYEDHNYYYLILDLVSGGEMFEHLIKFGAYSEADAARLMHEVASALAFIHGVGIVHMDLKPENLLLSTKNRLDGTIKMIDFGCAYVADIDQLDTNQWYNSETISNESIHSTDDDDIGASVGKISSTGTTAYWAPERFDPKAYTGATPALDMWSVGLILYIMLTGVHPFDVNGCSSDQEIEQHIKENPNLPFTPHLVGHLSESAIDLIKQLTEIDPKKRISAYKMLQHPWVRGETASKEKISDSAKKLGRYKDIREKLEATLFAVMAGQSHADCKLSQEGAITRETNLSSNEEINDSATTHIMERAFAVFDAEGKGSVSHHDLHRVASEHTGSEISADATREYITASSKGGNKTGMSRLSFLSSVRRNTNKSANLSLSDFKKLSSGLHHKHFPRGHYIFRAGDPGDSMYFLSSGKVEIQTRKGQLVSILRSGDFFGEGSLLDPNRTRFTSAKCATPVDVIEIKRDDFNRYVDASPAAKRDIMVKWRARNLAYAKNLLRLQKNVLVKKYKKGDVVYKEGALGTSMYRVDDDEGGELEVSHNGRTVHKYIAGDSFGESSLLFQRPRSSTVTCVTSKCKLHEMKGEDFLAVIDSSPEMAASLRNMGLKRLFKKAVKAYSLEKNRGLTDDDLVAVFHDADIDGSGSLNLDELRHIMHKMDPQIPMSDVSELLKYVDVDEDGQIKLNEFKSLFRQFDEVKEETAKKT